MEWLVGLFTGLFLNWVAFWILFVTAFLFESNERHYWSTFVTGVALFIGLSLYGVSGEQLKLFALAYIPIGMGWSIWRYFRWVRTKVAAVKDTWRGSGKTKWTMSDFDRYKASNNLDLIALWVLIWPISFLENSLSDVYHVVKEAMSGMFGQVFDKIHEKVVVSFFNDVQK